MAILSNGVSLKNTGQTDSRGNAVYQGSDGSLYTLQDGRWILSRPAQQFSSDPEINEIAKATSQRITVTTPRPEAYDLPDFGSYRGKAEEQVGKFFDKDFELLSKYITTAETQAKQKAATSTERIQTDRGYFTGTVDRDFAAALENAQNGYAGRDTVTSGFRLKDIQKQIEGKEDVVARQEELFSRQGKDVDQDLKNFLENLALEKEDKTLQLERQKESQILQRTQQLYDEDLFKFASEVDTFNDAASASLSFMREKLS